MDRYKMDTTKHHKIHVPNMLPEDGLLPQVAMAFDEIDAALENVATKYEQRIKTLEDQVSTLRRQVEQMASA